LAGLLLTHSQGNRSALPVKVSRSSCESRIDESESGQVSFWLMLVPSFGLGFDRMPGMRTLVTTLCLLTLSAVQVKAQITVKDYRATMVANNRTEVAELKLYIGGMGEGILWANSEATSKKTPLYCEPDKLELVADNYIGMIDGQIKKLSQPGGVTKAELDDFAIGVLLLKGLEETFPCKAK
jgi:hypothetical protein